MPIEGKLDSKLQFDDLELVKYLKIKESPFLGMILNVLERVTPILDIRICEIFPKYTLHDTNHSFRIIKYMGQLIEDFSVLPEMDVAMLICSALLHDVGMGVDDTDISAIKTDNFPFSDVKYSAMLRLLNNNEVEATQEFVRRIHADLSGRYIRSNLKKELVIPKMPHLDLTNELALICESHTKDYDWIKSNLSYYEVRGDHSFNPQYIACLLRLGDILDIDANRTPYRLYELIGAKGHSDQEWRQHFDILNNEKIVQNSHSHLREIYFYGISKNPNIHRKLLTYIGWVETELTGALAMVAGMKNEYNLPFDPKPREDLKTEGFTFSGYKMTLKFEAISSLLMGEKIYGSKQLGLRELIQNSLDACRIRQENDRPDLGEELYVPMVRVVLNKDKNVVTIKDNGIGMSLDIIKNHFLNIGVSYYKSFDFLLQDLHYKPIGNYGIGFLSCFMLSDKVAVKTRHYKNKELHIIEMNKGDEWTSLTQKEEVSFFGTEVVLNYAQFMAVFEAKPEKVREFLNHFFLTDGIDFKLVEGPALTTEINNQLYTQATLPKGFSKINLSDYLTDIEGYVLIKKHTNFVKNLDDLGFDKYVFLYNRLEQKEDEDDYTFWDRRDKWKYLINPTDLAIVSVDDYLKDNEIKYLSIPLVLAEMQEEFESGMKFTENDVQSVIEKLESKLTWITILLPKDSQHEYDEEITSSYSILEGLDYDELVSLGHCKGFPTYKFVKNIKLFEGEKNRLYLPYAMPERQYYYSFSRNTPRQELFIRNVLIKDFHFILPITASVFEVSTILVNINSRKFIPDISRNTIDKISEDELNYVVGKAIHMGAIEQIGLGREEQDALGNFVNCFYKRKSEFEKSL